MSDRDRAISDLAYRIWEEAGRPEGQGDRHWHEAQRRYDAGEEALSPKAKATAKSKARKLKDAKPKAARAAGGPAVETVTAKGDKAGRKAKAALDEAVVSKSAEAPKLKGKSKPNPADPGLIAPSPKAARSKKR